MQAFLCCFLAVVKEELLEEQSTDVEQQKPEILHVKEEQEESWASLEGEECSAKEEPDATGFPTIEVRVWNEDDEEKPLLKQPLIENLDVKAEADEEGCWGTKSISNPDLKTYGNAPLLSETKVCEDNDVNYSSPRLKHVSESETEDSDDDWKKALNLDGSTVNKSMSSSECEKTFNSLSFQRKMCSVKSSSDCPFNKCLREMEDADPRIESPKDSKRFRCNECGKSWNSKKHLTVHMRNHLGVNTYDCEVCGKRMKTKSNLKTHQKIHTGEKPFGCDMCSKRFLWKSSLDIHTRIHTVLIAKLITSMRLVRMLISVHF
uniref:C2H2-type domain-containing protein n=1 Tax=Cyprinodon variegatus TaxID=28743 RepID=A0A3Q2D6J2_CYPVA